MQIQKYKWKYATPKSMKVCDLKKYESMRPKKSMKVCDPKKYESKRPKKYESMRSKSTYESMEPQKYARHEITFGILMLPASGLVAVS